MRRDRLTPEQRSKLMSRVRSQDTTPEMIVRRLVHKMGFRCRLHRKDLPGKPDLTFPRYRIIIFVHGCFWHGHDCAKGLNQPKSNKKFWKSKLIYNMNRDINNQKKLKKMGWNVLVVWECQTKDQESLKSRISEFLIDQKNKNLTRHQESGK